MGLERSMVSSKLSEQNIEFLYEVERNLKPYPVSQSALVDLMVGIVRRLYQLGDINLEPKALQELLGTSRLSANDSHGAVPNVPVHKRRG